jgi:phenylalanyl-tRNA synthetase beta chain
MTTSTHRARGLMYSLLATANYNVARQNKNLALFEISGIETKKAVTTHLGIVLVGAKSLRGQMTTKPYDFFDAKGLFEALMTLFGIDPGRYRYERLDDRSADCTLAKAPASDRQSKSRGHRHLVAGSLREFDFKKAPVVMLEIDLGTVLNLRVSATKMNPLSKYPTVTRDLALVIDQSVEAKPSSR